MFEIKIREGHIYSLRYAGDELLLPSSGGWKTDDYEGTGWDEMLTTIEECEMELPGYGRVAFPDHGEAWPRNRRHERFNGRVLPYVFETDVRTEGGELLVRYTFTNVGPYPMPCFWAMHPAIVGEPERLDEPVRLTQDHPRFGKAGTLARVGPLLPGETLKYYYDRPIRETRFAAVGRTFRIWVEESDVPMYLGMWENAGGWREYVNFVPEFSTAGDDSALRALKINRLPFVEPGQSLRWSIRWAAI